MCHSLIITHNLDVEAKYPVTEAFKRSLEFPGLHEEISICILTKGKSRLRVGKQPRVNCVWECWGWAICSMSMHLNIRHLDMYLSFRVVKCSSYLWTQVFDGFQDTVDGCNSSRFCIIFHKRLLAKLKGIDRKMEDCYNHNLENCINCGEILRLFYTRMTYYGTNEWNNIGSYLEIKALPTLISRVIVRNHNTTYVIFLMTNISN